MIRERTPGDVWFEPVIPFRQNRPLHVMMIVYAALWIGLSIAPTQPVSWWVENILVFVLIAVLALTYRAFPFTNLSYLFMFLLLALHTCGAHFGYGETGVDRFLKPRFGLERDIYDRIVHFGYGLFMAYPVREFLVRVVRVRLGWTYPLAAIAVMSFSALFEIVELWVALLAGPGVGERYLGLKGDPLDGQRDMQSALIGAAIAMLANAVIDGIANKRRTAAGRY